MSKIHALIASFDAACESDSADAEHEAAMAMRDYLADMLPIEGSGDDDALEHFPLGEGFGDFDGASFAHDLRASYNKSADLRGADKSAALYARPREGGYRPVPLQYADDYAEHNAFARDAHMSMWVWTVAAVVVVAALVYLLMFGAQHDYRAMDSDHGPAPVTSSN